MGSALEEGRKAEGHYQYDKAAKLYIKSCDEKNMQGCYYLSLLSSLGLGVKKNYKRSYSLLKQACQGDYFQACNDLGRGHILGTRGREKNYKKAFELFKKACNGNNASGCLSLGTVYKNGTYVKKDQVKSKKMYEKSCKLGSNYGCELFKK